MYLHLELNRGRKILLFDLRKGTRFRQNQNRFLLGLFRDRPFWENLFVVFRSGFFFLTTKLMLSFSFHPYDSPIFWFLLFAVVFGLQQKTHEYHKNLKNNACGRAVFCVSLAQNQFRGFSFRYVNLFLLILLSLMLISSCCFGFYFVYCFQFMTNKNKT